MLKKGAGKGWRLLIFCARALREHRGITGPSLPLLADFVNSLLDKPNEPAKGVWPLQVELVHRYTSIRFRRE
jgi:hypothetical protein